MIQRASDPNASRTTGWRPAPADARGASLEMRRRAAHAWPFISRHGEKPAAGQPAKNTHVDSTS
ncbi:hypothetical protein [Ramlibacter sp.]|uniref:hypothetical protein n=1 Tax=Ramlibacter sp. TaxID=1917967 RepID=UPI003D12FCDE